MRRMLALALAATLTVVPGCGTAAHRPWPARDVVLPNDGIVLQVENKASTGMELLVVDGGAWRSIGFVDGASTVRFDAAGLDRSGAPLRIRATPVGGQGSARAGPLTVLPGQVVTFTIEADLGRSVATVR